MASINLYAGKPGKSGKTKLYLKLSHLSRTTDIPFDVWVQSDHFDRKKNVVKKSHPNYAVVRGTILDAEAVANRVLMEDLPKRHYTHEALATHITRKLKMGGGPLTFKKVYEILLADYVARQRTGTAQLFTTTGSAFLRWAGEDIVLSDVSYEMMVDYKDHLLTVGGGGRKGKPVSEGSLATYFLALTKVFNYAIRPLKEFTRDMYNDIFQPGLIPGRNPDGKPHDYKTDTVEAYEKLEPTLTDEWEIKACHTVLLSFYFQGITAIDLWRRLKIHIVEDYFRYKRYKNRSRKNSPEVCVKVVEKARRILDKYPNSPFLIDVFDGFPIVDGEVFVENIPGGINWYKHRRDRFAKIANALIKLGDRTGFPVTTYSMRYLHRTEMEKAGVRETVQNKAAGHRTPGMGNKYKNYDYQAEVDQANALVLSKIKKVEFQPEHN